MGLEATGTLRQGRASFTVRLHLDSDRLEARGGARLDLPFGAVTAATLRPGGALHLRHAGGETVLVFAEDRIAEKWARKILRPKSLIDKLGVKPGSRVAVLGVDDAEFLAQLVKRTGAKPPAKAGAAMDLIFYAADSAPELAKLKTLRAHLQPAGAVWVVSRKGKAAGIKDTDVMRAARTAGLVDNKVCGFSATHTALKLVIPRDQRG